MLDFSSPPILGPKHINRIHTLSFAKRTIYTISNFVGGSLPKQYSIINFLIVILHVLFISKFLACQFLGVIWRLSTQISRRLLGIIETDIDVYLQENYLQEITFSLESNEFGKYSIIDLKENGSETHVTNENKMEYVKLVCNMKLLKSVEEQMKNFLEGFYEFIPREEIAIFNEKELETIISGLAVVDVDDLKSNGICFRLFSFLEADPVVLAYSPILQPGRTR